ncbi:MAG TPA: MarR family transcriptional regulator [Stellaceae bacterium]|nr:MarR family transcriptional regulator [Stellaceae bacterium]
MLIDGTDEQFRAFIDDFVRLSARLQALRRSLASAMRMTPPQYNILMILARAEADGVSMSAVAERLRVSLSFVVSQMRALERAGLVRLRRNPADRRSVLGAITRSGHARILRAASRIQRVNDLLFASLTRDELRAMDRVINRILKGGEAAAAALKAK